MTMNKIKSVTVNGARVANAQQAARWFASPPDWMRGINRVSCGCGPEPGRGKFLIPRESFDANWPETDVFDIVIVRTDSEGTDKTLTLQNYVTVSAFAALRTPDSPMVVEVADIRFTLAQATTNRSWNMDGATGDAWADVLSELKTDSTGTYADDMAFATTPTGPLSSLKYEGWRTIDAFQDLANRTNHVFFYDPIDGKLKFADMSGTQSGLAAILDAATLYRQYEIPTTEYALEVGKVDAIFNQFDGSPAYSVEVDNAANTSTNRRRAWGSTIYTGSNTSAVEDEADALAATWFDWSDRATARECNEYFGLLSVTCGEQVSLVTWYIEDGEAFTLVDKGAPPPPETMRQEPPGGAGGGFVLCRVEEDFSADDLFIEGLALHVFGTVSGVEYNDSVTLINTIQVFEGQTGDFCIAMPHDDGRTGMSPHGTPLEIFLKPCDTNSLNDTGLPDGTSLAIEDPTFPAMVEGIAMASFTLSSSGGVPPRTYSVQSGALPAGVSLNSSTGQVSGTPTTVGSGAATFRVTDDVAGTDDTSSIAWTVGAALSVSDPSYPSMNAGTPITPFSVVASGGSTPYAYSVQAGSLPAGLSLNASSGEVSGTPTSPSSGSTTFRVTDDDSDTADTSSRPWTVAPAMG